MEIYHLVDALKAKKIVIVDDNRCENLSLFLPLVIFAFHLVSLFCVMPSRIEFVKKGRRWWIRCRKRDFLLSLVKVSHWVHGNSEKMWSLSWVENNEECKSTWYSVHKFAQNQHPEQRKCKLKRAKLINSPWAQWKVLRSLKFVSRVKNVLKDYQNIKLFMQIHR